MASAALCHAGTWQGIVVAGSHTMQLPLPLPKAGTVARTVTASRTGNAPASRTCCSRCFLLPRAPRRRACLPVSEWQRRPRPCDGHSGSLQGRSRRNANRSETDGWRVRMTEGGGEASGQAGEWDDRRGSGVSDSEAEGVGEGKSSRAPSGTGTGIEGEEGASAAAQPSFQGVGLQWRQVVALGVRETGEQWQAVREEAREDARAMRQLAEEARGVAVRAMEAVRGKAEEGWRAIGLVLSEVNPRATAAAAAWRDVSSWTPVRWLTASLLLAAAAVVTISIARTAAHRHATRPAVLEQWLDAAIPEPTAGNVNRFLQRQYERVLPAGMSLSKHRLSSEGKWVAVEEEEHLGVEGEGEGEKEAGLGREGAGGRDGWRERLVRWRELLDARKEEERMNEPLTRYFLNYRLPTRELQPGQQQRQEAAERPRVWLQRRWWKYRPSMPYEWLLSKIQNDEVEAAVFTSDMRRLFVTLKDGFPSEFKVDVPIDPFLFPSLTSRGIPVDLLPRSSLFFLRGLAALLPSLLIVALILQVQTQMRLFLEEKIHDYIYMDRSQLLLPGDITHEEGHSAYDDVIMGGEIWGVLEEIMEYMSDPMRYHSQDIKLPRGILISGPPGTGKTLLARAIAKECGLPFVYASGAEFVDSTSESGVEKVFNTFFTARANAPSFLFIDEIDALAGKSVVQDSNRRAVYEEFLAELDGDEEHTDVDRFSLRQAVILIAATNRPDELDEGLLKAGRIDRELHVGLPSEAQRCAIFKVHSRGRQLAPSVDFSKLAFRTIGFSGADIRNLVNEAGIMAVRGGHPAIEQSDIAAALDKQLFESLGIALGDEEQQTIVREVPEPIRRVLAVHEAGHILLAHLFPRYDWHAFTHILPGGQEKALSVFYPRQEVASRGFTTIAYLRMQMVVAHGGRCAEHIVLGATNVTDNASDDLLKLSRIAREIASSQASPRTGLMPMKMRPTLDPPGFPDEHELIPSTWSQGKTQVAQMSVELSEAFSREVNYQIETTEAIAVAALHANRHILDALVDHLLRHFRITGLDAASIIHSMTPRLLPDLEEEEEEEEDNTKEQEPQEWQAEQMGRYRALDIYPAPLHRC